MVRVDEVLDPGVPQVVLNEFSSLRVGDHFLEGSWWARVLDTETVPAPQGRNIPDAITLTYTADVMSSVTDHATIKSHGFAVLSVTDPGDRPVRIVREVSPGDRVRSVSDSGAAGTVVSIEPYANGKADVTVDADGDLTLTINRSDIYSYTEGTRPL